MIYLASPIDQASSVSARLRQLTLAVLRDAHEAVYDPAVAIMGGANDARGVVRINAAALERCDAVLALLPSGVATIGTPMEIGDAVRLAIPVAVVGGAGSVQLAGMGVAVFWSTADGAREAVAWLRETLDRHQPASRSTTGLG